MSSLAILELIKAF